MAIRGELTLDGSKFDKELADSVTKAVLAGQKMRHATEGIGEGMGKAIKEKIEEGTKDLGKELLGKVGLGAGLLGLAEGLHSIVEGGAKIYDLSRRFDTTGASIQRMGIMAKLGGTDVESLVTSVTKLQRNLENTGDPKVVEAMKELNLSARDLAGLDPDEVLEKIAHAFKEAQREGRGFGAVFDLMGKGAGELIALLRDFEEIKEKTAEQPLISDEQLEKLKKAADYWTLVATRAKINVTEAVTEPGKFFAVRDNAKIRAESEERIRKSNEEFMKQERGEEDAPDMYAHRPSKEEIEKANKVIKKDTAERGVAEREEIERAKEHGKVLEKEEIVRKQLEDAREAAAEAEMTDLQKIDRQREKILKLQWDMFDAAEQGPQPEEARLKSLLEIEKQLTKLNELEKKQKDEAARKDDEKKKKLEALEKDNEKNALKMLSPQEQAQQLRKELSESLGLKVNSADDLKKGLAGLQEKVDDAHRTGNKDDEISAREKLKKAQEEAEQLAGLAKGSRAAQVAGDVTTTLSILTGHGGSDLVLDEAKQSNQFLRGIQDELSDLNRKFGGNSLAGPATSVPHNDAFGFSFR